MSVSCFRLFCLVENARKQQMAAASGVELELLEPEDSEEMVRRRQRRRMKQAENDRIQVPETAGRSSSYFEELDHDLAEEWEDNMGSSSDTTFVDGKLISRDALKGIRVGSAGGWSLEVFPGDFVVHR